VIALFTASLPKLKLAVLTDSVGTHAPSDRLNVFELPDADAVTVAVCAELTAVTVAVKLALVAPEATVTEADTVTAELLLVRLTATPPVDAAALSVTVQLSVPAPVIEPLVQVRPLRIGVVEAST
jgi:hypothetical protein